ncbi:MAG: sulfite exporter TauE/SafE family protein [Chloroflexota bacterium]|nr:sulfite exporter TauE/SafE family protein [Chloroflexota bacterium]
MRRIVVALWLAILFAAVSAAPAAAHPLGNFTVNHFNRVTVGADAIRVRYVLDLAEIPTLQELQAGRVDGIVPAIIDGLSLSVGGVPVHMALTTSTTEQLIGQAGLATLRVTLDLAAPGAREGERIDYRDATFAGRIGWHSIVIQGAVRDASVAANDPTNELRSYPNDPTSTPPDVTDATATVDLAAVPPAAGTAVAGAPRFAIDTSADQLAAFLRSGTSDAGALLAALVVAMILGALHAIGPGHGKAMVAAYLVGSRGTAAQAVILGSTVTVTHTVGVYVLGAVTLVAAQYILPERLYPILGVLSGVLVAVIGLGLLRARWNGLRATRAAAHEDHGHAHEHGDGSGQHRHDRPIGLRGLLALGVSGGLLPCPTALVVLLAAVSFHNVLLGMILVAAFSVGLAAVLTAIGLAFVWGQRAMTRNPSLVRFAGSAVTRALPVLSAAAITVAGLVIAIGAARGFA